MWTPMPSPQLPQMSLVLFELNCVCVYLVLGTLLSCAGVRSTTGNTGRGPPGGPPRTAKPVLHLYTFVMAKVLRKWTQMVWNHSGLAL